jgi:hypothetical protein
VLSIRRNDINYEMARGGCKSEEDGRDTEAASITRTLLGDRVLLIFLVCAFFFHFANAAMLPQLGEMLSKGARATAAPFMSACIVVTQVVIMFSATAIGRYANLHGRKPLLLLGFVVLPVRAVLYTLIHNTAGLIAVQLLDGIANAIFGVVSVLVVADGRDHLVELVQKHNMRLIDMGHTHYNEVANDGRTIYTATRSTGQIEEGPVGFSVTNLDGGVVSWRFLELGELPAVIITSPSDERLITDSSAPGTAVVDGLRVRAKAWGKTKIQRVHANLEQEQVQLRQVSGSQVWEALLPTGEVPDGVYTLRIWAEDADGRTAEDTVRVLAGNTTGTSRERLERDQDNALPAWPEHGLLGTQLGPNKNGRKW